LWRKKERNNYTKLFKKVFSDFILLYFTTLRSTGIYIWRALSKRTYIEVVVGNILAAILLQTLNANMHLSVFTPT
jgi:hypothetical protein